MKRTPPPPPNTKKTTKAPPPPTRIIQQVKDQSERPTNLLLNNLDQEQQRPEVLAQKNQTPNPNFQQQNLTNKQEAVQLKQTSQGQTQLQSPQPQDNFNKEDSITPEQTSSISNRQQQMSFEKKLMPPKSIPPPNTNRKNAGPPPPKSKVPPPFKPQQIKQVQKSQNKQQPIESVEINEEHQKNHVQEKPLQSQQPQIDKNQVQSIKVEKTIPKSKGPPPPKSNSNSRVAPQPLKPKVLQKVKEDIEESPQIEKSQQDFSSTNQLTNTVNNSNESQRQHIQQIFPQKVAQKKTETQKQTIPKQKASQVNVQKSAQRSKLQQKLQQLRKAKQQMTQQYEEERFQAEVDQIKEQNNEENNQVFNNHNDIQTDKVDRVQQPIINEVQTKQQHTDYYQIITNNSTQNNQNKVQIQKVQIKTPKVQTQEVKPKLINKKSPSPSPPPTSKGRSAAPPPNIRSAPKPVAKQIPPQTTTTQSKAEPIEEKIQLPPIQVLLQTQNRPQVKLQQAPVLVSNEPSIYVPQVKKIEVEVSKRVQSPVSIEMNKLLERYHNLKSTYVSNIHQLEELVNFTKKQQQTQIQKINKLLHQLNRKNQQIKEICGLKTETHLEELPVQEEQLPV